MSFILNESEVAEAAERFATDSVLGPATRTLQNLVDWSNANSDGWCYWRKPTAASKNLQRLIADATTAWRNGRNVHDVVDSADVRKAYGPVKAFRTRVGADFDVVSCGFAR